MTRAVDRTLDEYVKRKRLGAHWSVAEKIAVCIGSNAQARDLIARGARLAEALGAELYVLHVNTARDEEPERKRLLDSSLQFAENLGANIVQLAGTDTARVTAEFVRDHRITQAIVGRSAAAWLEEVPLLPRHSEVHVGSAARGPAHRDARRTVAPSSSDPVRNLRVLTDSLRILAQSSQWRLFMLDVITCLMLAAMFTLGVLYVRGCDRLKGTRS